METKCSECKSTWYHDEIYYNQEQVARHIVRICSDCGEVIDEEPIKN